MSSAERRSMFSVTCANRGPSGPELLKQRCLPEDYPFTPVLYFQVQGLRSSITWYLAAVVMAMNRRATAKRQRRVRLDSYGRAVRELTRSGATAR